MSRGYNWPRLKVFGETAYANGLVAYVREIASRTEQYWCPIKHARRMIAAHERYSKFVDYGDAESYHKDLARPAQGVAGTARAR